MKNYYRLLFTLASFSTFACATTSMTTTKTATSYIGKRTIASDVSQIFAMRCDDVTVTQDIAVDGKLGDTRVYKSKTLGKRIVSQEGDRTVYKTESTHYNQAGEVTSTLSAVRRTKTASLPNGLIRETSEVESNFGNNGHSESSTYKFMTDYQIQPDGIKVALRQYRDGELVSDDSSEFEMTTPDGVIYIIDSSDKAYDEPMEDGSAERTLQYKSVCVLTPQS